MTQTTPQNDFQKSNSSNTTLVLIALGLGIVTAIMTNVYINQVRKQVEGKMFTVYTISRSYHAGEKIKMGDIKEMKLPQRIKDAYDTAYTPDDIPNVRDQKFARPVRSGQLLTPDLFTTETNRNALLLRDNQYARTIPVNSKDTSGILQPGMYVDLRSNISVPDKMQQSMTVLEKVKVLAVGNRTTPADDSSRSSFGNITVLVSRAQERYLADVLQWMGDRRGVFQVIFRAEDTDPSDDSNEEGMNIHLLRAMGKELTDYR